VQLCGREEGKSGKVLPVHLSSAGREEVDLGISRGNNGSPIIKEEKGEEKDDLFLSPIDKNAPM